MSPVIQQFQLDVISILELMINAQLTDVTLSMCTYILIQNLTILLVNDKLTVKLNAS